MKYINPHFQRIAPHTATRFEPNVCVYYLLKGHFECSDNLSHIISDYNLRITEWINYPKHPCISTQSVFEYFPLTSIAAITLYIFHDNIYLVKISLYLQLAFKDLHKITDEIK